MKNTKLLILVVVMIIFSASLITTSVLLGDEQPAVYSDEYVTKYFNKDQVMEVSIQINEDDWKDMLQNGEKEEFKTAKLTVNGDTYPMVNIRTKGNSSLSSVVRSDSDRYSFKINFSDIITNQTMAGLTQLNLNNCFSDPSYMREYLSYQIFEQMGVKVPACSYAAVYVNGEYFGLYLAVESILEPYLERNFGDATGDLYKSVGNTLQYRGNSQADYTGLEVKSSLKNADWSKLINMLDVLNNGGEIEQYLDVDAALRYIAVSTALANLDSYQGNFAHNYYLYEQKGVFTILPWDLNMSFGGFSFGTSGVYIDEPTQGAVVDRPLIAKLLENEDYREIYHGYLEQVATKYLNNAYLEAETARIYTMISEYVKNDPTSFYTYEQFEKNISETVSRGDKADIQGFKNEPRQGDKASIQGPNNGPARGNIPGILELASSMSELIQKQLSGELPSTNNDAGMTDGMGGGPMGSAMDGNGRNPKGMGLPDDAERKALDAFRQEVIAAEQLTDELREKASQLGIPEDMLEMFTKDRGGMMPAGMGKHQPQLDQGTLGLPLIASLVTMVVALVIVLFFKRRRWVTSNK